MTTVAREFGQGPLSQVTTVVYWFVVVEALLVATTAPGLVLVLLLERDASNLPLYALGLVPVGPALAAAVFAWRAFDADRDPTPARHFWRGYRLGAADALRAWVPALTVLVVLGINVAYGPAVGVPKGLSLLYGLLGVVVLLWSVTMVVVTAVLSFRWRDATRLVAHALATRGRLTLSLLSLLVLATGVVAMTSDWVLVLTGSILTFLLVRTCRPLLDDLEERYTG
jgi:hypothetical protein